MKKIKYRKVRAVQTNYLEYTGKYTQEPVQMQLFVYNENGFKEYNNIPVENAVKICKDEKLATDIKWFNIHGLHDINLIKQIGDLFGLENFVVGDILNTSRRTRVEEMEDVLFFSVKSVLPEEEEGIMATEQISFVLKDEIIISFQEKKSDYFTHIRERIRTGVGMLRKKQNDYLLYMMLDAIMENFFVTIEKYELKIEHLNNEAKINYKADFLNEVESTKDNIIFLKRAIIPLKDALYNIKTENEQGNDDYETINNSTHTYFSRLHHKCLELLDQIEYDLASLDSASNFHFSAQSQRMNQIMKTLTIVSVVFIPLTFIVGVYGMNFDNMPELHTQNGYYVTLVVMIVLTAFMVYYFKRKDWF
ncbi:magnesium/cobalt transporter CorA [Flavobacterium rhizosphaerae]|uniref:Magnesium transport protein CorA n=1 Tax=Flavobacterium rhizosphaerae TaxID=3163298 RepID=A0ABW8YTU2_9FLAO